MKRLQMITPIYLGLPVYPALDWGNELEPFCHLNRQAIQTPHLLYSKRHKLFELHPVKKQPVGLLCAPIPALTIPMSISLT